MQSYYHQNDNHPFIWYDEDYVNTCRSKLMNINYIELEDAFSFTKINKIPIVSLTPHECVLLYEYYNASHNLCKQLSDKNRPRQTYEQIYK